MDVDITVLDAERVTGLSLAVLREAIATGSLPATLRRNDGPIGPYRIRMRDLAAWCRRCGYTHLWAQPDDLAEGELAEETAEIDTSADDLDASAAFNRAQTLGRC